MEKEKNVEIGQSSTLRNKGSQRFFLRADFLKTGFFKGYFLEEKKKKFYKHWLKHGH